MKEKNVSSLGYDPIRDIARVVQFGFVDLAKANSTSSIPASIESEDTKFNGIEDPAAIAGRPADVFEHAQASKVIAGYVPPKKEEPAE